MPNSFKLLGIDHEQFEPLFSLSDEQLKEHGAQRLVATESFGFPCRVSLEDANVGDELILLPYLHQPAASPYRASGPIFVRRFAMQRSLGAGVIPSYVSRRLMSVRAYDQAHMMVAANVCEGPDVAQELEKYFSNEQVEYVHLHNAKRGCFSCKAIRA